MAGALCVAVETTAEVLSRRRLDPVHALTAATSGSATREAAFERALGEFRTQLTLLLSPLDELTRRRAEIPADLAEEIEAAARNARRLLNLADTLLDFTRCPQVRASPLYRDDGTIRC